jgi:outer membrane immunogenic protein
VRGRANSIFPGLGGTEKIMRKKLLLGVTVLALSGASAFAADVPARVPVAKAPPPMSQLFDWSGLYWGVAGGYGWGDASHREAGGLANGNHNADGWLLGGTVGYNWQAGQTVFGVEGDLSWANMNGSGGSASGPITTELSWLGTGRVRAGYAVDNYLFYVTGGAAWGKVEAANTGVGSGSNTRLGWTAGGGVETMLAPNWTAKLEYLYVDLGDKNTYTAATGPVQVALTSHIVRLGLNYKF